MMKIIHYNEVGSMHYDNDAARSVDGRVVIGKADGARNFCMRVFEIGPGGYTPFHKHAWEHEIFFHEGSGEVYRDGEWIPVTSGSVAFIPGKEEHQIKNVSSEPLIFVCLVPREAPEL